MLGFEPRISILETGGLPVSLHPWKLLVYAVGLAPTKDKSPPDLQSGALAAQPRIQK